MASLLKEGMATGNRREKMINQRWNDGGSYFARTPIIGNLNELLLPPFFIGVGDRSAVGIFPSSGCMGFSQDEEGEAVGRFTCVGWMDVEHGSADYHKNRPLPKLLRRLTRRPPPAATGIYCHSPAQLIYHGCPRLPFHSS